MVAVMLFATALMVAGALWVVHAADASASRASHGYGVEPRSALRLRGEVLFATAENQRDLTLDCMIRADTGSGDPENLQPAQIRSSGPTLHWLGSSLRDTIPCWLLDGRRVFVEVFQDDGSQCSRVRLSSEQSVVTLDVEEFGGITTPGSPG